jgi:hypothetical protein
VDGGIRGSLSIFSLPFGILQHLEQDKRSFPFTNYFGMYLEVVGTLSPSFFVKHYYLRPVT